MPFNSDRVRSTSKATHPLEDVYLRFNDEVMRTIQAIEQQYKGAKSLPMPMTKRRTPPVNPLGGI